MADIEGVDLVLGAEQKGELMNYLGNLQKHTHGEAVVTATKDIRTFLLLFPWGSYPLFSEGTGWM